MVHTLMGSQEVKNQICEMETIKAIAFIRKVYRLLPFVLATLAFWEMKTFSK